MVMTPEAWTVIGTGVVVLIAIATSHRHLRAEMKAIRDELRAEMNEKMNGLHARMDQVQARDSAGCANAWRSSKGCSKVCARRSPAARPPDHRTGRRSRVITVRQSGVCPFRFLRRAAWPNGWRSRSPSGMSSNDDDWKSRRTAIFHYVVVQRHRYNVVVRRHDTMPCGYAHPWTSVSSFAIDAASSA